jgi:hypothetical protein
MDVNEKSHNAREHARWLQKLKFNKANTFEKLIKQLE